VTLLLYFALGGVMYFLPFGLIRLGGYSATQAGAALLPFALIMGFGASFAGAVSDRFGPRLSLTTGPISLPADWRCSLCRPRKILLGRRVSSDRRACDRRDHHRAAVDIDGDGIGG